VKAKLTKREGEVLEWIGRGKMNPEIAIILGTSPRTVQKHVEHILKKLDVENRHAATVMAMEFSR
jgi:DNA-binding CsgD family transcriptional regulator